MARLALGARRSHGTRKQLTKRIPCMRIPVTNNPFCMRFGQRAGAETNNPPTTRVKGNSQTATRALGVSFLKRRAAVRSKGCSVKAESFVWGTRTKYRFAPIPGRARGWSEKPERWDGTYCTY